MKMPPDRRTPMVPRRRHFRCQMRLPANRCLAHWSNSSGLRLEPVRGSRGFIVIEHVQRPSEN